MDKNTVFVLAALLVAVTATSDDGLVGCAPSASYQIPVPSRSYEWKTDSVLCPPEHIKDEIVELTGSVGIAGRCEPLTTAQVDIWQEGKLNCNTSVGVNAGGKFTVTVNAGVDKPNEFNLRVHAAGYKTVVTKLVFTEPKPTQDINRRLRLLSDANDNSEFSTVIINLQPGVDDDSEVAASDNDADDDYEESTTSSSSSSSSSTESSSTSSSSSGSESGSYSSGSYYGSTSSSTSSSEGSSGSSSSYGSYSGSGSEDFHAILPGFLGDAEVWIWNHLAVVSLFLMIVILILLVIFQVVYHKQKQQTRKLARRLAQYESPLLMKAAAVEMNVFPKANPMPPNATPIMPVATPVL